MKIVLDVPDYNPEMGFMCRWEDEFNIKVSIDDGNALIIANKQGLISLANHFLNLAQDNVPLGAHLHLDEYNSLENGSISMIIQKN